MWSHCKNTRRGEGNQPLCVKMCNFSLWSCLFFFYISLKAQGEQNNSSTSSNMGSCTFGPLGKLFAFVEVKGWETLNGNKKLILLRILHSGAKVCYALKSLLVWGLNLQAHKHQCFLSNGFRFLPWKRSEWIFKVLVSCKGTWLKLNGLDAFKKFLQALEFLVGLFACPFFLFKPPDTLILNTDYLILALTMAFLPG